MDIWSSFTDADGFSVVRTMQPGWEPVAPSIEFDADMDLPEFEFRWVDVIEYRYVEQVGSVVPVRKRILQGFRAGAKFINNNGGK